MSNVNQSASRLTDFDHCSSDLCIALCCMFFSPDSIKMFSCHRPLLSCASPIHTCVYLRYEYETDLYFSGFRIRWDNTQLDLHRRHQGSKGRNKILLWANAYAARDMVSTSHLQDLTASIADARQIPIELMLQSRQVLTILVVTRSIYRWFNARKT